MTAHFPPPPLAPKPVPRMQGLRVVGALILREMATRYVRTPGGYIWTVLQPVLMIALLTIAFSMVLRQPPLGSSFVLFYATGYLPLRLFQEVCDSVGTALQFNKALMAYPRVTYVDSLLARAVLSILTQITVAALVMGAVFATQEGASIFDIRPVVLAYGVGVFLAVGIGVFNSYAGSAFPLYKTLWNTAKSPLILVSAVFYLFEDLPHTAQALLWYNPLVHLSGLMRQGVYAAYHPEYLSMTYVGFLGLVPLFFGVLLLRRFSREILYK